MFDVKRIVAYQMLTGDDKQMIVENNLIQRNSPKPPDEFMNEFEKDNNQINKIIFLFSISSTVLIAILLLITLIIKRIKTRNINRI